MDDLIFGSNLSINTNTIVPLSSIPLLTSAYDNGTAAANMTTAANTTCTHE